MGREVKFVLYDPNGGISLSEWNVLDPTLLIYWKAFSKLLTYGQGFSKR